jgi:predicted nucleic acid-binding protein
VETDIAKVRAKRYNVRMSRIIKWVYVETSVISGMFDNNDRSKKARPFWDAVFRGKIGVVISDVVDDEIKNAPQQVRDFYAKIPKSQIKRRVSTKESHRLTGVYTAAHIISKRHLADYKHIALAVVARADAIVSFNGTHIVDSNRIERYNDINIALGYPRIAILTPDEVLS